MKLTNDRILSSEVIDEFYYYDINSDEQIDIIAKNFITCLNTCVFDKLSNNEKEYFILYNNGAVLFNCVLFSIFSRNSDEEINSIFTNDNRMINEFKKVLCISSDLDDFSSHNDAIILITNIFNIRIIATRVNDTDGDFSFLLFFNNSYYGSGFGNKILIDNINRICIYPKNISRRDYIYKFDTTTKEYLYGICRYNNFYGFSNKYFTKESVDKNQKEVLFRKLYYYPNNVVISISDIGFAKKYATVCDRDNCNNTFCFSYSGKYLPVESKNEQSNNTLNKFIFSNIEMIKFIDD